MQALVSLREVHDRDLDSFYEHQRDPVAAEMAAFPIRERGPFMEHWAKVRADPHVIARTIVADGRVAGNIGSFAQEGQRLVGYWVGRPFWGKGVATQALSRFLTVDPARPLHAHVAKQNIGSIRVLEKCHFRRVGEVPGVSIGGGPPADEFIFVLAR